MIIFLTLNKMMILTVVGSSKKTNVGLAINAIAALVFRLFPPLKQFIDVIHSDTDDHLICRKNNLPQTLNTAICIHF